MSVLRPKHLSSLIGPLAIVAATVLLLVASTGCSPAIGDACETNQQCGTGAICDTTAPEGYCTITPCDRNACSEEAVCIEFEDESTYCMFRCESDSDCRAGYACRTDKGPVNFCYVK